MLRTTRPFELKFASDTKPGSFSGYGAVFDNIDDGGDMIAKGAFADTLAEWKARGKMPKMLWHHGLGMSSEDLLPIGYWTAMEEDDHGLKVEGPAGRIYGRGLDQSKVGFFPWCQVFANHPWFKAARELSQPLPFNLTDGGGSQSAYVPYIVNQAQKAGRFQSRTSTAAVPPGSMFFVPGITNGTWSHIHVGIVVSDDGQTITTIEGNTNHDGSSNGYEVAQRFRRKASCDYGIAA